jgi:prepilin-type N-terminal cleavage/methylation domain-containing protein
MFDLAPRHASADGFTMIEMVVAMVIASIVLMAAGRVVLDSLHGTSKATNNRTAQQTAVAALEQFAKDIRQAQSPDRSIKRVGNPESLRDQILLNNVPAGHYPWDITRANDLNLWFVSDVVPEGPGVLPEPECVGWYVDTSVTPHELHRFVRTPGLNSWKACGPPATGGDDNVMAVFASSTGNVSSFVPTVFSYDRYYNRFPNSKPIDPSDCEAPVRPPIINQSTGAFYNWRDRNSIRAVRLDLRTAVDRGDVAESKLLVTADIETRLSHDYLFGMGCSF